MLKLHFLGVFMLEKINHVALQTINNHVNSKGRLAKRPRGPNVLGNQASEEVTCSSILFCDATES